MAITCTNVTNGLTDSAATSYTTASITCHVNKLIFACITTTTSSPTTNTPTCSGASRTWTQVGTSIDVGNQRRVTIFRSLSSTETSGTLTFDLAGQSQSRGLWSVVEFDGMVQTGTNGANAVVQSVAHTTAGTVTGTTVTMGAFGSSANATFGVMRLGTALTITAGSGFTEISVVNGSTSRFHTQFRNDNDTSVDWSWTNTNIISTELGIEIKASNIKSVAKVLQSAIKKINGVPIASIKKIGTVAA